VDHLVIDHQLSSTIIDDQCSNGSSTIGKRTLDLVEQTTLVDDLQALLHITTLGHADKLAIISNVQDAILLVDRAEHALDNNRFLRIRDEATLFLKLTSEEVDT